MKKIFSKILIILISTTLVLGSFGLFAQTVQAETQLEQAVSAVSCVGWTGVNLTGCMAHFSYWIYLLSSMVLSVSGYIFNSLLSFTLSGNVMNQGFVNTSWVALRDIANSLFILVLVVISLSIILDVGKYKSQKQIAVVIMVALLVNFSLFFSRVVIDAGNIVALGFYDAISIDESNPTIKNGLLDVVEKDIAGGIMSRFNTARMIGTESFSAWNNIKDTSSANLAFVAVFIVAIILNIYTAYLFFMAGWIFVARVVYLWVLMIFSPLAVISYAIPDMQGYWKKWWDELLNKSFCVVVFMFMIWLTLYITGDGFFGTIFNTKGIGTGLVSDLWKMIAMIALQSIIVLKLLGMSLKKTQAMCNDGGLGNKMFGFAKTAGAFVTGGASVLATQKIGGWAQQRAEKIVEEGGGTGRWSSLGVKALRGVGESKMFGKPVSVAGVKIGGESYTERRDRVAKEHTAYMKTLSKKDFEDKETGEKISAQEKYRRTISEASPITYVMGERVGEKKFTSGYEKAAEFSKEIRNKQDELEKLKNKRELLKKGEKDFSEETREINQIEDDIQELKEKLQKTGVGFVKPPKEKKEEVKKEPREEITDLKMENEGLNK